MKLKKYLICSLLLFVCFIANISAKELLESSDLEEVVAETTKYYKTVTLLNNSSVMRTANIGDIYSITTEVSEEEYNSISPENNISPQAQTVETSYKKITATISKFNSNYFKYTGTLTWKNMPSTRSYDIMGLGYFGNVTLVGEVNFKQSYCTTDGVCNTSNGYYQYKGQTGSGAMFALPSGSLSSLTETIYILVEKTNKSTTVLEQELDADYSHAQKAVSYSAAKGFYIDTCGIQLNSDIYSSYDSMPEATTRWSGTW
ncbi:MAG: hypothetical protein K2H20_01260 [Bacilli bacterium]|nr:hypothetical protein [Bacilli bacterium]